MTRHGSGLGEGARGAYRERAGGAEGSNGAVMAAGGADGSNDASDAVTASIKEWPWHAGGVEECTWRELRGREATTALAVAAVALAQAAGSGDDAAGGGSQES